MEPSYCLHPKYNSMAKTTKARISKRRAAKRVSKRNPNNVGGPNTCKVVETVPSVPLLLNTPTLITKVGITGNRAPAIAKEFGLYRIASLKFTMRPIFDTYSSSLPGAGNGPNSVPTLYWKMNRYGDFPAAFNGDYMRALGAKPNRFDDKQIVIKYAPNILVSQNNGNNAATSAGVKMTPWLSTDDLPADNNFNLSTAAHYGHTLFIEGGGSGTAVGACGNMDVEVVYEFKNPRLVVVSQMTTSVGETKTLAF